MDEPESLLELRDPGNRLIGLGRAGQEFGIAVAVLPNSLVPSPPSLCLVSLSFGD
jgi:hypothetical protein